MVQYTSILPAESILDSMYDQICSHWTLISSQECFIIKVMNPNFHEILYFFFSKSAFLNKLNGLQHIDLINYATI